MVEGLKINHKPPSHLKKVGKDTWYRIWSILESEGKANFNDPIAVEMIAYSYQMYKDMAAQIKKDGLTMEYTNKANATNLAKHTLIPEIPKYMQQIRQYLGELGLTGASRKKLQEGLTGETGDDFDTF
ncbi:phage terminase small subunit P27 family [Bacillus mycoides]|uniref:phage terminase small subunit P27 family n=1 Tax=Bacillus mycoides TaxID=1405 RepID=UPI003D658616